ncbi:MAG: hypothetical protein AAGK04_07955 [Planctomycetota bacterium]
MRFHLIDRVIERAPTRIVAIKQVTMAEEYLADHFPSFPVLPGVLMLEALVQAARELVETPPGQPPMVLGRVRALKYGALVQPGDCLRIEVDRIGDDASFKGKALRLRDRDGGPGQDGAPPPHPPPPPTAAAGRFELRPVRLALDGVGSAG